MKEDKEHIEEERTKNRLVEDDEIDLVNIAKIIWLDKKILFRTVVFFGVLGIIIALASKVEYLASSKLLPENQEGLKPNLGGLGSLAGLAGINLDFGSQGTLTPDIYPEIAKSLSFQLELIKEPIHFKKLDKTISSYDFFKTYYKPSFLSTISSYTIGLPGKIKKIFTSTGEADDSIKRSGGIIYLNLQDKNILDGFKKRINVEVDNKTGIITISTEMPDKIASAELTQKTVELLQKAVIDYKINKSKENLNFIRERHAEAKRKFEISQEKLAHFTDRNRNILSSVVLAEEQRLQNEYNLAFEVYKGLSTQLEQAEIKVKENTPVFTTIEPIQVPLDKSKPKRKLIFAISISLGIFLGISIIFTREFVLSKFKK